MEITAAGTKAAVTPPDPRLVSQFLNDGYVVLRGFLQNAAAFRDAIESTVRLNIDKPIFWRFGKPLALADLGFTFDDFMTKSSALRLPEIHALDTCVRSLIDACDFEQYLRPFVPDADHLDLLQSLYFPFSSTQASHADKFLVSPPQKPYRRETLIGVWLALDSTSLENGALFGWSGSHLVADKPLLANYRGYGDYVSDLVVTLLNAGGRPHFIRVDEGDVVLWASDFVHGGASPVSANLPRRALVLHYGMRFAA